MNRDKLKKLANAICDTMEREDIDWEDISEALADAFITLAHDYQTEEPEKHLNAPPPDLPCWAWDRGEKDDRWLTMPVDINFYQHEWQPCFVPLDAKPGQVWALYKDGCVTWMDSIDQLDKYDHENALYVYTVPGGEA